jgi:hypothetical protein
MSEKILSLPEASKKEPQNGGGNLFDEIMKAAQQGRGEAPPEPEPESYDAADVENEYFEEADSDGPPPFEDVNEGGEDASEGDGLGFDFPPPDDQEDEPGPGGDRGNRADMALQAAKFHVNTCRLVIPQFCAAIDGGPGVTPDKYNHFSAAEWEGYELVTYEFFKTIKATPSPGLYFLFATASMFAGPVYMAYKERKAREKMEADRRERGERRRRERQRQEAAARANGAEQGKLFEDEEPAAEEAPQNWASWKGNDYSHLKEYEDGRRYFQTGESKDGTPGFYIYTLDREYIKKKDRNERASHEILELKRQGITENADIIEILGIE